MPTQKQLEKDYEIFQSKSFNGVIPSPEDERDFTPKTVAVKAISIPKEYMAPQTEILNQGAIGSCVAHSSASALMAGEEVSAGEHNNYSRGYIYGNRRSSDYQGEGMYIRQAIKNLNKYGDVFYVDFPYNIEWPHIRDLINSNNSEVLAALAAEHKISNYYRCYTENDVKQTILTRGGVIICVPVYNSFGRDIKKPEKDAKLYGYHAMLIIGWTKDYWIVQNSWGKSWGYNGLAHMDYDYPVNEYWGITVKSQESVDPIKRSNIFERIGVFFTKIFNFLKKFFTKNKE